MSAKLTRKLKVLAAMAAKLGLTRNGVPVQPEDFKDMGDWDIPEFRGATHNSMKMRESKIAHARDMQKIGESTTRRDLVDRREELRRERELKRRR